MAAPPDEPAHRRSAASTALQAIVLLGAVGYIAWSLAGQWEVLRQREWTLRAGPALLSLPLAAGWFLCRAWLWQRILAALGHPLAFRPAFRTWVLSELARYLPGKVWHLLGRSVLSRQQGVPASVALTGLIFELGLVALAAMAFLPLRAATAGRPLPIPAAWAAAAVLVLLVVAHPHIILPLINAVLRRTGRPPIAARLHYGAVLGMLGMCLLMWTCLGLGFVLLAASLTTMDARDAVAVAASFPVAWVAGLIAVVSPGGLGVREGVLAALLSGVLPGGMALVVALASRVWLTGVELACAAAVWRRKD